MIYIDILLIYLKPLFGLKSKWMAHELAGKSLWVAATPEIVSQQFMGLPTGTLKGEPPRFAWGSFTNVP